jgi:transposase
MPMPFAPRIILSQNLRTNLHVLAPAHSTPQSLALRARIVLRAADADTPNNVQIGRDLHCSHRTVGTWRRRYHALGFAGLQEAPRSGRPRTVSSRPRVTLIAVATQLPQDEGRTVTRGT